MKTIILIVISVLLVVSCTKITDNTIHDDNEDGTYYIGPSDQILGNVELLIYPKTRKGTAITFLNSPVSSIAYLMSNRDDPDKKYFAKSHIEEDEDYTQTGSELPFDTWIRIKMIVYEDGLANWVIDLLNGLGLNFFNAVEDWMVEETYEADFKLVENRKGNLVFH